MTIKNISFTTQIVIAVILGVLVGLVFPQSAPLLSVVGDIFLRLMQMSIPLLVLGQIVQAIADIKIEDLPKLGFRTIAIFAISSLLASFWGILSGYILQPGSGIQSPEAVQSVEAINLSISETIVAFFPQNIFQSLAEGSIIQIIIFSLFLGIALNYHDTKNPERKLIPGVHSVNDVVMDIIGYVMIAAPIGIFALISKTISDLGLEIIIPLVKYLVTFAIADVLFFTIWLIVIMLKTRISPIKIVVKMKDMLILAAATTSSAVTLPIAVRDSKEKLGLSDRVADFVVPLGMPLNSNGSAMHMALTVITVAQLYEVEMSMGSIVYLGVLATFVSLANAVVPGADLVSLAIIIPQMGLPVESIGIFAGVSWFVGILRTVLNVGSDVFTAILVADANDEIDRTFYE